MLRNPPFCSFASFSIVSLNPFNNKPESSRDSTIFMSFISSFNHPEPKIFLCIPASATAVNPNGIKTLSANGLITFLINDNPVFNKRPRSIPRNPPDCIVLDNWVFNNLISVDELFAKALRRFATCLLVNNNSCGKLDDIWK